MKQKSIYHNLLRFSFFILCGGISQAISFGANSEAKSTPPKSAEDAGWELVFQDDFDRSELGEDWEVVDGSWKVEEGALKGSGTLISSRGFPGNPPGFLRLEFEAASDVKPFIFFKDQPTPEVELGDISSFIHARPPADETGASWASGYFFQFGGKLNTIIQILRAGSVLATEAATKKAIKQDQIHHIVVENDEGTLRFLVDGELLFEKVESLSILGEGFDRVGFFFYTAAKVQKVKVYTKRMPDGLDMD